MPTEIAMATSYLPTPEHNSYISTETKSGSLILVAMNGRRQPVNVKVYKTSIEHFAVLYPQKKMCRPLGVINLKNTTLERNNDKQQTGFKVRQQGFDTPMTLTFMTESLRELDSWMSAFTCCRTSPALRHQSSLPIVEEDDDELL